MNINKLKGKVVEQEMNIEMLAEAVGIDRSSLYRKFSAPEKFTIGDALKIKEALALSDADAYEIFLA